MNPTSQPDPIRIGVCGLGYGLEHISRLLSSPSSAFVRVEAICDSRADRLRMASSRLGITAYSDLSSMMAGAPIEAVALFTGPSGRARLIREVIHAGKHVMTTKPFELDAREGLEVLEEARRIGRVVFINSPAPVLGQDIQVIRSWRDKHSLGRLIFSLCDCWYSSWEKADGTWYDDPKLCPAAPIFRIGIYGINDILSIADDELAELQVLQSRVRTGRPTPDVAQLSLRFSGGSMATVRASWCCDPVRDNQASEFVFERGVIRRTYSTPYHWTATQTVLKLEAVDAQGKIFEDTAVVSNQYTNSAYRWDLFHAAVRGTLTEPIFPPERLVGGIRVIEIMKKALENGGVWRSEP